MVRTGEAVAVGITLYPPRNSYGYELADRITELAPNRALFKIDDYEPFRGAFVPLLEEQWPMAERKLRGVVDRHPGKALILLCWERVDRPGDWCHRQLCAEFMGRKLGIAIEELPVTGRQRGVGGVENKPATLRMAGL